MLLFKISSNPTNLGPLDAQNVDDDMVPVLEPAILSVNDGYNNIR